MDFAWNRGKATANERKHGVSFAEAMTVFGDPLSLTGFDPTHSHAEERFVTMGTSAARRGSCRPRRRSADHQRPRGNASGAKGLRRWPIPLTQATPAITTCARNTTSNHCRASSAESTPPATRRGSESCGSMPTSLTRFRTRWPLTPPCDSFSRNTRGRPLGEQSGRMTMGTGEKGAKKIRASHQIWAICRKRVAFQSGHACR